MRARWLTTFMARLISLHNCFDPVVTESLRQVRRFRRPCLRPRGERQIARDNEKGGMCRLKSDWTRCVHCSELAEHDSFPSLAPCICSAGRSSSRSRKQRSANLPSTTFLFLIRAQATLDQEPHGRSSTRRHARHLGWRTTKMVPTT